MDQDYATNFKMPTTGTALMFTVHMTETMSIVVSFNFTHFITFF